MAEKKTIEKLQELKLEMQEEIYETIERETSLISKTIEAEVRSKQESLNSDRDGRFKEEMD